MGKIDNLFPWRSGMQQGNNLWLSSCSALQLTGHEAFRKNETTIQKQWADRKSNKSWFIQCQKFVWLQILILNIGTYGRKQVCISILYGYQFYKDSTMFKLIIVCTRLKFECFHDGKKQTVNSFQELDFISNPLYHFILMLPFYWSNTDCLCMLPVFFMHAATQTILQRKGLRICCCLRQCMYCSYCSFLPRSSATQNAKPPRCFYYTKINPRTLWTLRQLRQLNKE